MSIVVGFIDTPEGNTAVQSAIDEAKLRSSRIVILHSMQGGHQKESEYLASADAIERVEQLLADSGVEYSTHEYVRGNEPAEDIVAAAKTHEAELIVIGIRRRSATGKLLMGSNALDILHDAPVPVLCVKAGQ
ncbi:MAG: universal stress protein [Acidimicrobiia bacterium]|nr:universal stress protein [Acidimicrobiia bacterium]